MLRRIAPVSLRLARGYASTAAATATPATGTLSPLAQAAAKEVDQWAGTSASGGKTKSECLSSRLETMVKARGTTTPSK